MPLIKGVGRTLVIAPALPIACIGSSAIGSPAVSSSAVSAPALHAWQNLRRGRPGAEGGEALIIDVRAARQFQRGHLPGSHSIPVARLLSTELLTRSRRRPCGLNHQRLWSEAR